MPQRPRPYRPKAKGCYECSQRRISCDRTEPQCNKCESRNLKCSGLGVRHRFTAGVAVRGRWSGKTIQNVLAADNDNTDHTDDPRLADLPRSSPSSSTRQIRFIETTPAPSPSQRAAAPLTKSQAINSGPKSPAPCNAPVPFEPAPCNLPLWKRVLLLHFSERIAIEMLSIDGLHNGWRHMILPIAHRDELVMDAVLAVSAAHMSLRHTPGGSDFGPSGLSIVDQQPNSNHLYGRAIASLSRHQDLRQSSQDAKESVLLSLLVLLISVMVTGSHDFPILYRILQSAFLAVGGEQGLGDGDLAHFIIRQIQKMRVYGAPFISEEKGRETLSSENHMSHVLDCLKYCSAQRPENSTVVPYITSLVYQARDMYLSRVDSVSSVPLRPSLSSVAKVQRFKETLETFPRHQPGGHTLIWATFIAASECSLDEHKAFFENELLRLFARNGFANILHALDLLRNRIWKENGSHNNIASSGNSWEGTGYDFDVDAARRYSNGHEESGGMPWPRLLPGKGVFIM